MFISSTISSVIICLHTFDFEYLYFILLGDFIIHKSLSHSPIINFLNLAIVLDQSLSIFTDTSKFALD